MNHRSQSPKTHNSPKLSPISLPKIYPVRQLVSSKSGNTLNVHDSSVKSQEYMSSGISPKIKKTPMKLTISRNNLIKNQQTLVKNQEKLKEKTAKFEFPLKSFIAVSLLEGHLPKQELIEMINYETIYFIGKNYKKSFDNHNDPAFDDENYDLILNTGDHVAFQYEIQSKLGNGAFSKVYKCFDHKSSKDFALKVIKSHKRFVIQSKVEIKILKAMKNSSKIYSSEIRPFALLELKQCFKFRNHTCLLFELLGPSLYQLLENLNFSGLSVLTVKNYSIQILESLNFLRMQKIIHCDLKPENIATLALNASKIKLIDFGSACFEKSKIYSYIQSRIYRAPEVILGLGYGGQIDMWSFGCVLVEMLTGRALFDGVDECDQLGSIIEVIGMPPHEIEEKFYKFVSINNKQRKKSKGKIRTAHARPLESIVGNNQKLIDLLKSKFYVECLTWSPDPRITPKEALQHKWLDPIKPSLKLLTN